MTTYFYGRNSDIESFDRGSSIDTQLSKAISYANIKDLKIDEHLTEQVSGTVPFEKREKGFELLQKLKKGDHIICSHLDRFSRNTLNLLTLVEKFKRQKVSLHFVDIGGEVTGSDAIGGVFLKLLSVFAEFYAKQISEKSKATKQRMIKENRYTGGKKKFGWDIDDNGFYVPCEKEQSLIRLMKVMRKQGKTFREISDAMTNSTRKKFPVSWVFKILTREENQQLLKVA
jgi:DNA invertase Pin-like site-specific DNA recombinase